MNLLGITGSKWRVPMQLYRTTLAVITALLLSSAPLWARGQSNDNDSPKGSGSSGGSTKNSGGGGSSRKGSGGGGGSDSGNSGGNKSNRGGNKADRDRAGGGKGVARGENARKWPDVGGRDGDGPNRRPRCPNGRRDCRENCCNRYGYGEPWGGWDPVYDGWGFPWPDPSPGRIERDEDRVRASSKNVELRISPLNVEVFVNGIRYSKKGNTKLSLASGFWTIEIRAEGYLTETLNLEIKQGDRYTIERKLQRNPDYRPPIREKLRNDA